MLILLTLHSLFLLYQVSEVWRMLGVDSSTINLHKIGVRWQLWCEGPIDDNMDIFTKF